MIEKFRFYFKHSINDLRVNGQRTFFALLCIAAGVAAIVSLQTLAVMIQDTLRENAREANKGDIKIENGVRLRDIDFNDPEFQNGNFNFENFEQIVRTTEAEAIASGILEEVEGGSSFFQGCPLANLLVCVDVIFCRHGQMPILTSP